MSAPWTPMRWPAPWTAPAALELVKSAGIDTVLVDGSDEFEAIRVRAPQAGLRVIDADFPPDGVRLVKGVWPGVRASRGGADASAGPTGVPWVDSNGWLVRLHAALAPDAAVWVDAAPPAHARAGSYLAAIADAAAHGGRWALALDDELAVGISRENASAMAAWKTIAQATAFFAARREWADYRANAIVGIVSDFAGENEFFSHELLNLLARAGAHYRVLPKAALSASDLRGLRAAIYADAQPPSPAARRDLTAFAEAGGLVITTPVWGDAPSRSGVHPRYYSWAAGKGHIARAIEAPSDPFEMANDAVVLISHRYDLVRFWNAGAAGSFYGLAPGGDKAIVHLLFYADYGPDNATVRVAGPYTKVKASMVTGEIAGVRSQAQKDALEVYLPRVSQYVALELSV